MYSLIVNEWTGYEALQTSKEQTKMARFRLGVPRPVHNLLFCAHTLCMSYVTYTFLLVSSSVRSKQLLCFVHRQGQKGDQKHVTKNFVKFHNHSPLLTMILSNVVTRITSVLLEQLHPVIIQGQFGRICFESVKTTFS